MKKRYVIVVMYDLPVTNSKEQKEVTLFRKYLKRQGFFKVQKSVYGKVSGNQATANMEISEMKSKTPKQGVINALIIGIDDFVNMKNILGEPFDMEFHTSEFMFL